MTLQAIDYSQLRCPYCEKPLSSEEYEHVLSEFKTRSAQEYEEHYKERERFYDQQIKEQEDKYQKQIKELSNVHKEEIKTIQSEIQNSSQRQLEDIKKFYIEILSERQKEYKEMLEQQSAIHKKEINRKDSQYKQLHLELEQDKLLARKEASQSVENEIQEKNIQILRLKEKVESLNNELTKTQSELRGEAGEVNLVKKLKEAFPMDVFTTQSRGTSSGDIIQNIKTESGVVVEMPIVYDNKESKCVTKQDIGKAQRYKNIHGTDYVIIVSKHLPNTIAEEFGGEREGVLIVHPCVLILVVTEIRKGLLEISKQCSSKRDQKTKQSILFDYIRSQGFSRMLQSIYQIHLQLTESQKKEEKSHQVLWKSRDLLYKKLVDTYNDISSGIESIIHERENTSSPNRDSSNTNKNLFQYSLGG